MSLLSQFAGGARRVAALINAPSRLTGIDWGATAAGAVQALSGALAAGVFKTVYAATGRGRLLWAGACSVDATVRTVRLRITVDGQVISQAPVTLNGPSVGAIWVGAGYFSATAAVVYQPIDYSSSLLIEVQSSLAETDKVLVGYAAEVHQ